MKKIYFTIIITFILLTLFSCSGSGSNDENNQVSGILTEWSRKEYYMGNLISHSTCFIAGNRIISQEGLSYDSGGNLSATYLTNYNYSGNLLSSIEHYFDGNFNRAYNFEYNNNNNLITSHTNFSTSSTILKETYAHENNLTILRRFISYDNGLTYEVNNNGFTPILELTFDSNNNVIESKPPGEPNANGNFIDYTYDNNENLIHTAKYPSTIINYNYTNKINPFRSILINTYGKKAYVLTQRSNTFISIEGLSNNVPSSMSGEEIVLYSIENNYSSDYLTKMKLTNDSSQIIYEFEYE